MAVFSTRILKRFLADMGEQNPESLTRPGDHLDITHLFTWNLAENLTNWLRNNFNFGTVSEGNTIPLTLGSPRTPTQLPHHEAYELRESNHFDDHLKEKKHEDGRKYYQAKIRSVETTTGSEWEKKNDVLIVGVGRRHANCGNLTSPRRVCIII